jgi:flagellar basal body-associated protein FliL
MANILHRLFFDKEPSDEPTFLGIHEPAPLHKVESFSPTHATQHGGAPAGVLKDNKMEYMKRWNIYIFMFFISVLLTIITMKDDEIIKGILKTDKIYDMSNDISQDPKKRWILIIRFTIVFICFVIAYNLALLLLLYAFNYMASGVASDVVPFRELIWRYTNQFGQDVQIGKTWIILLILITLVVFVIYVGFSKFYPSWFDNLYFQSVKKKKDDTQVQKYAYTYGLFMLAMMIFVVILLNITVVDHKLYTYYNFIFLLSYLIMMFLILKELKFGNLPKLAYIVILVFLMFFFYPIIMSLIRQEQGASDIFTSSFLTNIIFNFGLKSNTPPR